MRGTWAEEVRLLAEEIENIHQALSKRDSEKAGKLRQQALEQYLDRIKEMF